jgi:hypothetical protein
VIRLVAVTCLAGGCWTGAAPAATPAPPVSARPTANTRFPVAEISAIRACSATGPTALVVRLTSHGDAERLELQLAFRESTPIPKTFVEGQDAEISICAFHGCTRSSISLAQLEIGVGARGHYHVEVNAGPTYDDTFEAAWVGTPWQVRPCPYEMNPP